jgi:hypothetical protein
VDRRRLDDPLGAQVLNVLRGVTELAKQFIGVLS